MEGEVNKSYKWVMWVLVAVVIVLVIAFVAKKDPTVSETYEDINDTITECNDKLTEWNTNHPEGTPLTEEEQAELDALLEECTEDVEDAQESL